MGTKKKKGDSSLITQNRRARFDYEILTTYEAGIVLLGTEVKALRNGAIKLDDAHVQEVSHGLEIVNLYIPEYNKAHSRQQHNTKRPRVLLLHKREIKKIASMLARDGLTMIPLKMFFNEKGFVKVLLGLGRGKKLVDRRQSIKSREWNIQQKRVLKNYNS